MKLSFKQEFKSRSEISDLLGGDKQKGIAKSDKTDAILLFTNEEEIYTDYFYPKGTYQYCMYTGIGRNGHQDSLKNKVYGLNVAVLAHRADHKHLLVFEKSGSCYCFIGEYRLTETHQNVQPDDEGQLRRVFVFHLEKIANEFEF